MAKTDHEIRRSHAPAISVITWIEVMTGAAGEDESSVLRASLSNFLCSPITREVAERAAVTEGRRRSSCRDGIILATAEVAKRQLVPRNVKDFRRGCVG